MREIKFRGKRVDTNEWVYGYLVNSGHQINPYVEFWWIAQNRYDFGSVFNKESCDDTFIWNRVEPDTIGQYTGLNDKNGIEIYEGDIVRLFCNSNGYYIKPRWVNANIVWNEDFYGWEISFEHIRVGYSECIGNFKYDNSQIEVIGNIYDNPELMEEYK